MEDNTSPHVNPLGASDEPGDLVGGADTIESPAAQGGPVAPADNPHGPGSRPAGKGTSSRGFANMDPQRQREIASKGGKAAHAQGAAHEFTPAEAAAAGRKGGQNSHGGGRGSNRTTPGHAGRP